MKLRTTLSGKAARIAAAQEHTGVIGDQLSSPIVRDDFANIEAIPVHSIRPDPDQPRQLGITMEMLRNPESVIDARTRAVIDDIIGLSLSLKSAAGQRMPIEVYQDGGVFRLLSGERRWWAAQLAQLDSLKAKVLHERPADLRLKQYIENAQRADLTPAETLSALQGIIAESAAIGSPIATAVQLREKIGLTKTTAHRWWSVLHGPEDVIVALAGGLISLTDAEDLTRIDDPALREAAIKEREEAPPAERQLGRTIRQVKREGNSGGKAKRRGRPAKISFGSTTNPNVARVLVRRVLGTEPADVNWDDRNAVAAAIKAMIKHLEKELST